MTVSGNAPETACLQVKFAAITTLPLIGKQSRYSPQVLTYIHALEPDPPTDRPPTDWKLVTNLPVTDLAEAVEKLNCYALRWKAEVFYKVMRSDCRAEDSMLQTAERLVRLFALVTVVSWRIFFLTMAAHVEPYAPLDTVLTAAEINALHHINAARPKPRLRRRMLADYLLQIAMFGGYLARSCAPRQQT